MGQSVPSDPARDDGAIGLLVAQFNFEIGEDGVGTFNDGVDRPQVTLLKQCY
jgi:hypothetical protein